MATNYDDVLGTLASEGVDFLLAGEKKLRLRSVEEKKKISTFCLFFSANWCRPCRSFMPRLLQLYASINEQRKQLEIITVSLDRDDVGFDSNVKQMPWLAVPFDPELCRRLCGRFRVECIPSLIPLSVDGAGGEDAVQLVEDYGVGAFPFGRRRREELRAMDESRLRGGSLAELLGTEDRNFVVSRDGTQVPIDELMGKTIGLYFSAHWCPPCHAFTTTLTNTYKELKSSTNAGFEIIFISTDKDIQSFNSSISTMPWLTLPFTDNRTIQDLTRIYKIKRIPALIILSPDGKAVQTDGRALISCYGVEAFPFTETRVAELEGRLREDGEGLAKEVRVVRHEHVLKLERAGGYVCDQCGKTGRHWVFSCGQCNFDLHPACAEEVKSMFHV